MLDITVTVSVHAQDASPAAVIRWSGFARIIRCRMLFSSGVCLSVFAL